MSATTTKVSLRNSGGPLDSKIAHSAEGAAKVALRMIAAAGGLYPGDTIVVEEVEEKEESE